MENLKWSRYNFLLNSSRHGKFIYNSYTNTFLELDDSLFEDFNSLSQSKSVQKDLRDIFSQEELMYFKDNYILNESDDDLVDIMHHQSMARIFDKKHLVLTIAPTQNCNFNCSYCYEKWRNSGSMSDETEDALIKHLNELKVTFGLETINLTWYGGEPLLEHMRIASLGKKINKLGIKIIECEIITNGYLFNEKNVQTLIDVGVNQVQITIDGFKEIHDQRRPLLSGIGTFDKIIKNLDFFFANENKDKLTIALRVNIDKSNSDTYLETYNWLKSRYPQENLLVYPGWIYLDETNEKKCDCFGRNEATDFCLDLSKNNGIVSEKIFPDDINMECLVRNPNSLIVGWKGEIYKCFEDLGNEELIVGSLHDKDIWTNQELISKYSVGIDHYNDPKCIKCSYLPICNGGCPLRRLENKYHGKSNDCCTPFKGRLNDYLELYYENIQRK
ncbi:radical SAM protein [Marinifilum sp.]|uniref:radical SAM protein n=1 Tax=Marinifilum sp. TaxID=2033137 RepID=UPI003BACA370